MLDLCLISRARQYVCYISICLSVFIVCVFVDNIKTIARRILMGLMYETDSVLHHSGG